MRRLVPRRSLIVAAVMGLLATVLSPTLASGQSALQTACSTVEYGTSMCAYVTNRVLVFGEKPGELQEGEITRSGTRNQSGNNSRFSTAAPIPFNLAGWNYFEPTWTTNAGAVISYRGVTEPLASRQVSVRAYLDEFAEFSETKRFSLSCLDAEYLVCTTPDVWKTNREGSPVINWIASPFPRMQNAKGIASIESRPLIVKVLNMTDQPLVRAFEVRANGAIRDTQTADPETIRAGADGRTGAAYYHFYRDASRANSVALSYAFVDGAGATSLTGGVLDIDIAIDQDGTTEKSQCTVPSGGAVTIECSVTMLGLADGILQAVVTVGV